MQPQEIANCAGCKRVMYLLANDVWCFYYFEKDDQEWDGSRRTYLDADEPLDEAVSFGPTVFCSVQCVSDFRYAQASESEQSTMRVFRDACYAILDQPEERIQWKERKERKALIAAAKDWLASQGCDNKDSYPAWMNVMTREDRLARAARHVAEKLDKYSGTPGFALMASELREALEEK